MVSILNVTQFVSAKRGPLQNREITWDRIEKICPSVGNCSAPGEKSSALLQQLIPFDCSETG
jgi:hypothetical protein